MIKKSFLLFQLLLVLLLSAGCIQKSLSEMDHALLVTIGDLKGMNISIPEKANQYEKFTKTVYLDGTVDLDYEYEIPDGIASDVTYLTEGYSFNRTSSDKTINDLVNDNLFVSMMKMYDLKVEENKGLSFSKGAMKIYEIKSKDGLRVGNHLVMSKGMMNYTFSIIGVYIESKKIWSEIFSQKLEKAEKVKVGIFGLKHRAGE